jgi:hypothetical protein
MADLITHARTLFDDRHPEPSSPPLPPAPVGEPIPPISYGTSHTKVAEIALDDFTPRMPPRPPQSIHPSSRVNGGGPMSPTKSEPDAPPPLPLRPGGVGVPAGQLLRGIHGLDFEPPGTQETDVFGPSDKASRSGSASPSPTKDPKSLPSQPLLPPFHDPIDTDDEGSEQWEQVPQRKEAKPEEPPQPLPKD